MLLGIDFGTTKTVVSVCEDGNFPIVHFEGPEGELLNGYPTLAAEKHGEWRYGVDALPMVPEEGWTILSSFKRELSRENASLESRVRYPGGTVSLLDLLTRYLQSLREALLERSTLPQPGEDEPLEVMVATPAHAHSTQRFLTLEAFRRAGFVVRGMQSEPTAAGIDYARRYLKTFNSVRDLMLVYDLGGGTFDVSLIHKEDDTYEVLRTAGLPRLGGDDFDQVLMKLVLSRLGLSPEDLSATSQARLRLHCRDKKEALNPNTRKIAIELGEVLSLSERAACGDLPPEEVVLISTQDYYRACEPLIEKTLQLVDEVLQVKVESDEGPVPAQERLAGIYVVGGASWLPAVGRFLRQHFQRRYHRALDPSAATAIGLAITLFSRGIVVVHEYLSRNFGVFREAEDGSQASFDLLLNALPPSPPRARQQHPPAKEPPPTKQQPPTKQPPSFVRVYRPTHNIGHFRYIECDRIHNHTPEGNMSLIAEVLFPFDQALRQQEIDLRQLPVRRTPQQGPLIEERYSVNDVGCIEFSIRDLENGYTLRHHFTL